MSNNLSLKNLLTAVSVVLCLGVASCTINDGRTMSKRMDDTKILLKVESAIHNNNKLPHTSAISVNNHGNIIQLSGFVDTQWEKDEAGRTARNVERVEGVINSIIVKDGARARLVKAGAKAKAILHHNNR